MSRVVGLLIAVIVACGSANAQGLMLGPDVSYTVSTSVPEEVSSAGAPTRFRVGVSLFVKASAKLDIRFMLGYRIENGAFNSPYVTPSQTQSAGWLDVVEPNPNAPKVNSELNSSSVDLGVELFFPIGDLDTSGSKIGFSIGAFADRVLSATQTDDYSAIPNYIGPKSVTVDFKGQFGFGATIGVGILMPIGTGAAAFDLRYVFRQPETLTADTAEQTEQNVGWLIGRGLKLSLAYYFQL